MTRSRTRLRRASLFLGGAVVALLALGVAVPSGASASPHRSVEWAVTKSACPTPARADAFRCFAESSVPAKAGTPGAVAYTPSVGASGPAGGLAPADLARVYGYKRTAKVTQTVAIVDWYDDPYALSDLNHYDATFHLPKETSKSFRKVNQKGATKPLPAYNAAHDNRIEISLDVQAVRAVCQHCKILLVEASTPTDSSLAAAENTAARLGATEISNSWGGPENAKVAPALVSSFRHPGVVITASTGDDGWYGWDWTNMQEPGDHAASFPSTLPYVVSVGGTSLTFTSSGTRARETVWNDNGAADSYGWNNETAAGATGGGCSRIYGAPYWQTHQAGYAATDCKGKRLATDVSVDADPRTGLSIYYSSSKTHHWIRVGGTSLSSPIVAAMYALAGGSGGSEYPAASLYVNSRLHPSTLYDVTVGANGFCGQDRTTSATTARSDCSTAVSDYSLADTNNPNTLVPRSRTTSEELDCGFPFSGTQVTPSSVGVSACTATAGFDGPSGLGAPKGLGLFKDTSPYAAVSGPKTLARKHAGRFTAALSAIGGARITSVHWSFDGGASITAGARRSVTHAWKSVGHHRVTLQAEDSTGQLVVRTYAVTVH